jgi:hypothetical protein
MAANSADGIFSAATGLNKMLRVSYFAGDKQQNDYFFYVFCLLAY